MFYYGDGFVSLVSSTTFEPTGGQFGPDATGISYSKFLGVGEDGPVGTSFSLDRSISADVPFKGETEILGIELEGEVYGRFGLQLDAAVDPGSINATLPYELQVAYSEVDATTQSGDVIDLFFGSTFDASEGGFHTIFPSLSFSLSVVGELSSRLAASVSSFGETLDFTAFDFASSTEIGLLDLDTNRQIIDPDTGAPINDPFHVFGMDRLEQEAFGIDTSYADGWVIDFGDSFEEDLPDDKKADAETTGDEQPDESSGTVTFGIDLGSAGIYLPNINTVSTWADGVFVTDPTREWDTVNGVAIDDPTGEGNRDDLATLTLDLDGLLTYGTGYLFPPLELTTEIEKSLGPITATAGFGYNLFDVELEAALPLEQEFTLTPKMVSQLRFFETDGAGNKLLDADGKGIEKAVEVHQQRQAIFFDPDGTFYDEAVATRLRELSLEKGEYAAQIEQFNDLDRSIAGAFTGTTNTLGGAMYIRRADGTELRLAYSGDDEPGLPVDVAFATSEPFLGQNQNVELELADGEQLFYRIFIGSGTGSTHEDFDIAFSKSDTVYREEREQTPSFLSETPWLEDMNALNLVYDEAETFVEVHHKAVPIVTNRTGLEFDLSLLLSALSFSYDLGASVDLGPLTLGASWSLDLDPLYEEEFALLNLDIIDLFNDSFEIADERMTAAFAIGETGATSDLGDAIVGTAGNDTLLGTDGDDTIIGLGGTDTIVAGDGDDLIQPGRNGTEDGTTAAYDGGAGEDTLSYVDLDLVTSPDPDASMMQVVFGGRGGTVAKTLRDGESAYNLATVTGVERIVGSRFDDRVVFHDGADASDEVHTIDLGEGNDFFLVNGIDIYAGPDSTLSLRGGDGDDQFQLEPDAAVENVLFDGGVGTDTLFSAVNVDLSAAATASGVAVRDIENVTAIGTNVTEIIGDDGRNVLVASQTGATLKGGGGSDDLLGSSGDDTLIGGKGADLMDGAGGYDTVDYSASGTSVYVAFSLDEATNKFVGQGYRGEAQGDLLKRVDEVKGSAFEDILISAQDYGLTLDGGEGDDRLVSNGSDDVLRGGRGNDLFYKGDADGGFVSGNARFEGGAGFDLAAFDARDWQLVTGTTLGSARYWDLDGTNTWRTRDLNFNWELEENSFLRATLGEGDEAGTASILVAPTRDSVIYNGVSGSTVYDTDEGLFGGGWVARTGAATIGADSYDYASLNARKGDDDNTSAIRNIRSDPNDDGSATGSDYFFRSNITNLPRIGTTSETVKSTDALVGIEGIIGTRNADEIFGSADDNALYGNGSGDFVVGGTELADYIEAGAGDDTLSFGEGQSLADVTSFPGGPNSGGNGTHYRVDPPLEPQLLSILSGLDPDRATVTGSRDFETGLVNAARSGEYDMGSFLWGQAGTDTLDLRFDRGLDFRPFDTGQALAIVDLDATAANVTNTVTGERTVYGEAYYILNDGGDLANVDPSGWSKNYVKATLYSIENVIGTYNGDRITGDGKDNVIEGLAGRDIMEGAGGFDTLSYANAAAGVTLSIAQSGGTITLDNTADTGTGDEAGDLATGFEAFLGSDHGDTVTVDTTLTPSWNYFGGTTQANALERVSDPVYFNGELVTPALYVLETVDATFGGGRDVWGAPGEGVTLDTGDGDDAVTLTRGGHHTVDLGRGDDTATVRDVGFTLHAGDGDDTIEILTATEMAFTGERTAIIDGGRGEDVVRFTGANAYQLSHTENGTFLTIGSVPIFYHQQHGYEDWARINGVPGVPSPIEDFEVTNRTFDFLVDDAAAIAAQADSLENGPIYELRGVEVVEINGERVRLDNPDPVVDADKTIAIDEDAIDAYDLNVRVAQVDIDAGTTYRVVSLPDTATITLDDAPVAVDAMLLASEIARLVVVPGQNFTPRTDLFTYERQPDPADPDDVPVVLTKALPNTVRGVALDITAHEGLTLGTEVEIEPFAMIDMNRGEVANEYVKLGGTDVLSSDRVTLEFLFRQSGAPERDWFGTALASYEVDGQPNELLIYGERDGMVRVHVHNEVFDSTTLTTAELLDGDLHRISATYDAATGEFELYVDGTRVIDAVTATKAPLAAGGTLVLGQEQDTVGGTFDTRQIARGEFGDIRVFDGVRDAQAIADDAFTLLDAGTTGLAASWRPTAYDEVEVADALGGPGLERKNDPGFSTAAHWSEAPIGLVEINAGDATGEYAKLANVTELSGGATTLEFLFRSTGDLEPTWQITTLAGYEVAGGGNDFAAWGQRDGFLELVVQGEVFTSTTHTTADILDGAMHRVTMSYDPATQSARLFVDGAVAIAATTASSDALAAGGTLMFGQEQDGPFDKLDPNQISRGEYGDIRVFDSARDAQSIADDAFTLLDGDAPGLVANWRPGFGDVAEIIDRLGGRSLERTEDMGFTFIRGTQERRFETTDGGVETDTVTITVTEVPTAGTVFFLAATAFGTAVEMHVAVGDELTAEQLEGLYFRADPNFAGDPGRFSYTVADDAAHRDLAGTTAVDVFDAAGDMHDGSASQTVSFDIAAVNDAPNVRALIYPISPGGEIEGTIAGGDVEGDAFGFEIVTGPSFGTIVLDASGRFTYAQDAAIDFAGAAFIEDTFTVRAVEDASGLASAARQQSVRIVNPLNHADIVFDETRPDVFFDDDGNPIALGGLGTDDRIVGHRGADELFGFDGNDTIEGGEGDDTLNGGRGADAMDGGAGIDWVQYGDARGVLADIQAASRNTNEAKGDTYRSIENLIGTQEVDGLRGDNRANEIHGRGGGDVLHGRGGADVLDGGEGDDRLFGGADADQLIGGLGEDWAYHNDSRGVLVDLQNATRNTNEAAGDTFDSIENLSGTEVQDNLRGDDVDNRLSGRSGNDTLHGRRGEDVLDGGDGDDRLFGGADADHLIGGAGSDWAHHSDARGVVVDLQNGARNTNEATGDILEQIENLSGTESGDGLRGDNGANSLQGRGGDDVLHGRGGADVLNGGEGNDYLFGGGGADELIGGLGVDRFRFLSAAESRSDARDRVRDFEVGIDKIDLRPIDANGSASGNAAFTFLGTGAFTGAGAEVRFENGLVQADIDGDAVADMEIELANVAALSASDFLL